MTDNYAKIVRANLEKLYAGLPPDLAGRLAARQTDQTFSLKAFGQACTITPEGIFLENELQESVLGILISLYALHAAPDAMVAWPFKGFKELPDSMPYTGAFGTHTERVLIPHVAAVKAASREITERIGALDVPPDVGGDFALVLTPLPKIALCYIFYEADDEFPASVTCLYSHNAQLFLPTDGLADVGEYTSQAMIACL